MLPGAAFTVLIVFDATGRLAASRRSTAICECSEAYIASRCCGGARLCSEQEYLGLIRKITAETASRCGRVWGKPFFSVRTQRSSVARMQPTSVPTIATLSGGRLSSSRKAYFVGGGIGSRVAAPS